MQHVVTVSLAAGEARRRLLGLERQWRQSDLPPEFRERWVHRVRSREMHDGRLRLRFEPQGRGPYVEAVIALAPSADNTTCDLGIHTRETATSFWGMLSFVLIGPAILVLASGSPWYVAGVGSLWLAVGWRLGVRLRIVRQDRLLEAVLTHLFGAVRLRSAA